MLLDWVGIDKATLTAGSAEELPFGDASMDVVACFQVLEHLRRPDVALSEIHRVLKPGGYACLATPNLDCLSRRIEGKRWHGFRDDHIALRNARQWRQALESSGFEIISDGSTMLSGVSWLRFPPLMLINWIPLYLFGYFPWYQGESYMAFCRKPAV
jgi:SAM-dependent methyltransferase